jgi:hypothetical protein
MNEDWEKIYEQMSVKNMLNEGSWREKTYEIGSHFLPALVNGDYSGLYTAEKGVLDDWIKDEIDSIGNIKNFNWSADDDYREKFGTCEIVGLKGLVKEVTLNYYL